MIVASDEIKGKVITEQHVLDGGGMPDEWKTSVTVSYRGVNVLEHAIKFLTN